MTFIADLHVHSKYSIATAKNLDLEHVYIAAQKKGITVVATGDFTHPLWMAELKAKLIPAEPGLFRLKKAIEDQCDQQVPPLCRQPVRFMLTTEVSNIYKKNGKTRKNHNLVLAPGFSEVEKFSAALDRIGNIKSDGRPILGLDARNLLEILLEVSDEAILVPAHIWTPWFSMLGSKSGFDTVESCFEDLTPHIFAVETGLSSDPAMNWRVSALDKMTLISNSDAHSPMKLGREANVFNTDRSYFAIRHAIKTGNPELFKGTLEFFPEEGKYHLDGHKKCGVRFTPRQTIENNGICPVCNKPLTLGVLYRVDALADRDEGSRPPNALPYQRLVPLMNILSELLGVGVQSKKVQGAYEETLSLLGDEFSILITHPLEHIQKMASIPLLAEAIGRMRAGQVDIKGGYDGEFGTVRIFAENEKNRLMGQKSLFQDDCQNDIDRQKSVGSSSPEKTLSFRKQTDEEKPEDSPATNLMLRFNSAQQAAITHGDSPLIIVAGPGTGKTMTITGRMVHLIKKKQVPPDQILAVTFTNKAAKKMRTRLKRELSELKALPMVATFHAFCLDLLRKLDPQNPLTVIDDEDRERLLADAVALVRQKSQILTLKPQAIGTMVMTAKQRLQSAAEIDTGQGEAANREVRAVCAAYDHLLTIMGVCDYEDLIVKAVDYLENGSPEDCSGLPQYRYIFIDEYQDVNEGQYRLIRALVSPKGTGLCVIGDPDQAIYGFRGSDIRFFQRFVQDFPEAQSIRLNQNYRSTETILNASIQVINSAQKRDEQPLFSGIQGVATIDVCKYSTPRAEAAAIGRQIVKIVGGRGYHDLDLGRSGDETKIGENGFDDIAVLYRTGRQGELISDMFQKMGIPFQVLRRHRQCRYEKVRQLIALLTILSGNPIYSDLEIVRTLFEEKPTPKTLGIFKQWGLEQRLSPSIALSQADPSQFGRINSSQRGRLTKFIQQIAALKSELNPLLPANQVRSLVARFDLTAAGEENDLELETVINRIVEQAAKNNQSTANLLTSLALESDTDTFKQQAQNVALMTMHAAKGLEFPVVFIAGCEAGLIPYHRQEIQEDDWEEERRLFYVAMTRAQKRLILTWAQERQIHGRRDHRHRSPFIDTIDSALLETVITARPKPKAKPIQRSLFDT